MRIDDPEGRQPSSGSAWSPLVLDEGQPARTEGLVLRLGESFGMLADGGVVVTSDGVIVSASPLVELRPPAALDLGPFEGRELVAVGTLVDRRLVIDGASALSARPGPVPAGRVSMDAAASVVGGKQGHGVRTRPDVERALMQQGLLLDIWDVEGPPGSPRRIALATHVDRVRAALSERYGEALDVVQARWSEQTLRDIERVLDEDDLAWATGRERGPDSQLRVTATLLHLPSPLAGRLEQFPAEALALEVLVRPA
jgi:hypothetical protein